MNEYMMESYFENISNEVEISVYEHLGGDLDELIDDSLYIEGANLDARAYFKEYKREFKILSKKLKNEVKACKYDDAKNTLKECDAKISEGIDKVMAIDYSNAGSFISGLYMYLLPDLGRNIAISLIPLVGLVTLGSVTLYETIIGTVNSIKRTKEKGGEVSLDNFNFYKNRVIEKMKEYKKSLKKYYTVLGAAEDGKVDGKEAKKKALSLKRNKSE